MKKEIISYYNDLEDYSKKSYKKIWLVISILSFTFSLLFLSGITGNVIAESALTGQYAGILFLIIGAISMFLSREGWKIRRVDYRKIHNVSEGDMEKLVKSLELKDNLVVGDFMCGYGDTTYEIGKYVLKKRLRGIQVVSSDFYKEQLNRLDKFIPQKIKQAIKIIKKLKDIRKIESIGIKFDRIVIKMGLHEIPLEEQKKSVREIYKILKKGGIFSMWDVMPKTKEGQLLFQKIIRKKDELAGFGNFAKRRYFCREEEIKAYLKKAGFKKIKLYHEIKYRLETHKRLDQEFKGDKNKLIEWNNYIRKIVSENMKKVLDYKDNGKSIAMTFRKGIVIARK